MLEEGETQLAGQMVPRVLFQSDFLEEGSESVVLVSENCLLVRGSNAYLCKATCPKDRFAEIKLSFQKIMESFVLLP